MMFSPKTARLISRQYLFILFHHEPFIIYLSPLFCIETSFVQQQATFLTRGHSVYKLLIPSDCNYCPWTCLITCRTTSYNLSLYHTIQTTLKRTLLKTHCRKRKEKKILVTSFCSISHNFSYRFRNKLLFFMSNLYFELQFLSILDVNIVEKKENISSIN